MPKNNQKWSLLMLSQTPILNLMLTLTLMTTLTALSRLSNAAENDNFKEAKLATKVNDIGTKY